MEQVPSSVVALHPLFLTPVSVFCTHLRDIEKKAARVHSEKINGKLQIADPWTTFLYDHPIHRVEINGLVAALTIKEDYESILVDDGTDTASVMLWKTTWDGKPRKDLPIGQLELGTQVRITGKLKLSFSFSDSNNGVHTEECSTSRESQDVQCSITIVAQNVSIIPAYRGDEMTLAWWDTIKLHRDVYSKPAHEIAPYFPISNTASSDKTSASASAPKEKRFEQIYYVTWLVIRNHHPLRHCMIDSVCSHRYSSEAMSDETKANIEPKMLPMTFTAEEVRKHPTFTTFFAGTSLAIEDTRTMIQQSLRKLEQLGIVYILCDAEDEKAVIWSLVNFASDVITEVVSAIRRVCEEENSNDVEVTVSELHKRIIQSSSSCAHCPKKAVQKALELLEGHGGLYGKSGYSYSLFDGYEFLKNKAATIEKEFLRGEI